MKLSDLTTLRIGGRIRNLVEARTAEEVIEAVAAADAAGEQLLVLGGGSNLVASDEPFDGTVVLLRDPEEPPLLDATLKEGAAGPDEIHLVGECANGREAVASIRELRPDLARAGVDLLRRVDHRGSDEGAVRSDE